MIEKPFDSDLIEATQKWLGEDGMSFFGELAESHNTASPVIGGSIPYPVHFREGMQVRNFMRSTDFCKDWSDHDFDENWMALIEECLMRKIH